MVTKDWGKIVEGKIAEVKKRGCRKREWAKIPTSFLQSSVNYRFELNEQAVWIKLVLLAITQGDIPGLISDNDFRPVPYKYLAHLATCPLDVFESMLKKAKEDDSVFENSHGLFLTHFDDYQFTEYDRQRPYREAKRQTQLYKKCPECHHSVPDTKAMERFELCPLCIKKGKEIKLVRS